MVKTKSTPAALLPVLALAALTLLTTGCLNFHSTITIRRNGAVDMRVHYTISSDLTAFGTYAAVSPALHGAPALPVSKNDFLSVTAFDPTIELRRYRSRRRAGTREVTAHLRFANIESINRVFPLIHVTSTGDSGQAALTLTRGIDAYLNTDTTADLPAPDASDFTRFADEFFADYTVTIELRAPRTIVNHDPAQLTSNRRAEVTYTFAELLRTPDPIVWSVRW